MLNIRNNTEILKMDFFSKLNSSNKVQKAKIAKNPKTKAVVNVPEKTKFVFKPSLKNKYL